MDLRFHYCELNGRIGRLPFLGALALLSLVAGVVTMIGLAQLRIHQGSPAAALVALLFGAAAVANLWAALAVYAKRLHDVGLSGWFGVLIMVGVLAQQLLLAWWPGLAFALALGTFAAFVALLTAPGERFANAWGPPPGADEALTPAE